MNRKKWHCGVQRGGMDGRHGKGPGTAHNRPEGPGERLHRGLGCRYGSRRLVVGFAFVIAM